MQAVSLEDSRGLADIEGANQQTLRIPEALTSCQGAMAIS
jgi:hypothetical protein